MKDAIAKFLCDISTLKQSLLVVMTSRMPQVIATSLSKFIYVVEIFKWLKCRCWKRWHPFLKASMLLRPFQLISNHFRTALKHVTRTRVCLSDAICIMQHSMFLCSCSLRRQHIVGNRWRPSVGKGNHESY